MSEKQTSRRNVLYGAAAVGVAAPILAACGSDSGTDSVTGEPAGSTSTTPAGTPSTPASGADGAIPTADIPVGGGKIFDDTKTVVTQPAAGEFKAFTAVCTHNGCLVSSVSDGTINCPCHGSRYSITDGSVQGGPAPAPLAEKTVTVKGKGLTIT